MDELQKYSVDFTSSVETGLYSWALNERDSNGAKIGHDYIGFEWSVFFRSKYCEYQSEWLDGHQTANTKLKYDEPNSTSEKIVVDLAIGREADERWYKPDIFILGYDTPITSFSLTILPQTDESDDDIFSGLGTQDQIAAPGRAFANAWGPYRYENVHFGEETADGALYFYVYVGPDQFAQYKSLIQSDAVQQIDFTVARVDGFYAEWTPTIVTDAIRILLPSETIASDVPHSLGNIGETTLRFITRRSFEKEQQDYVANGMMEEASGSFLSESSPTLQGQKTNSDVRVERLHYWVIVLLVGLILAVLFAK